MIDGIEQKIGENTFIVPPLNFKGIKKLLKLLDQLQKAPHGTDEQFDLMCDVVLIGLQRNYPELTRDELEEILDIENIHPVIEAITGQAGLKKKVIPPVENP